jgi:hypothetical protein
MDRSRRWARSSPPGPLQRRRAPPGARSARHGPTHPTSPANGSAPRARLNQRLASPRLMGNPDTRSCSTNQSERRPGSRRRNDDRGPAGGTTTGSRRRNTDPLRNREHPLRRRPSTPSISLVSPASSLAVVVSCLNTFERRARRRSRQADPGIDPYTAKRCTEVGAGRCRPGSFARSSCTRVMPAW